MTITQQQLAARKNHLGSSDISALIEEEIPMYRDDGEPALDKNDDRIVMRLPADPYSSPLHLYNEKKGLPPPDGVQMSDHAKDAARLGNLLEPVLIQFAEEEHGALVYSPEQVIEDCPIIVDHSDAVIEATGEPIEIKTAGLKGRATKEWGEDGSDEIPFKHHIQCQVHLMAYPQAVVCRVYACLGGIFNGFNRRYIIRRDPALIQHIKDTADLFWTNYILANVPPEPTPNMLIARHIDRMPKKVVEIADETLMDRYRDAKTLSTEANLAQKLAKLYKEKCEAAITITMGDAEACLFPDSGSAVTFYEEELRGVVKRRFKYLEHGLPVAVMQRFLEENRALATQ